MTLKNAAARLPHGGGKAGIDADRSAWSASVQNGTPADAIGFVIVALMVLEIKNSNAARWPLNSEQVNPLDDAFE